MVVQQILVFRLWTQTVIPHTNLKMSGMPSAHLPDSVYLANHCLVFDGKTKPVTRCSRGASRGGRRALGRPQEHWNHAPPRKPEGWPSFIGVKGVEQDFQHSHPFAKGPIFLPPRHKSMTYSEKFVCNQCITLSSLAVIFPFVKFKKENSNVTTAKLMRPLKIGTYWCSQKYEAMRRFWQLGEF